MLYDVFMDEVGLLRDYLVDNLEVDVGAEYALLHPLLQKLNGSVVMALALLLQVGHCLRIFG